jgi:replicase
MFHYLYQPLSVAKFNWDNPPAELLGNSPYNDTCGYVIPTDTLGLSLHQIFTSGLENKFRATNNVKRGAYYLPKEEALRHAYIGYLNYAVKKWLVLDIDYPYSQSSIQEEHRDIPIPNFIVRNPVNNHCHLFFRLETPVNISKNGSQKVKLKYKHVYKKLCKVFKADTGFNELLAKNPFNSKWKTEFIHVNSFSFSDFEKPCDSIIAAYLRNNIQVHDNRKYQQSKSGRMAEELAVGRNHFIFHTLRRYAYSRVVHHLCLTGKLLPASFRVDIENKAQSLNQEFCTPKLDDGELDGIIGSVCRYCSIHQSRFTSTYTDKDGNNANASIRGKLGNYFRQLRLYEDSVNRLDLLSRHFEQGIPTTNIIEITGLSRSCINKYKKLWKTNSLPSHPGDFKEKLKELGLYIPYLDPDNVDFIGFEEEYKNNPDEPESRTYYSPVDKEERVEPDYLNDFHRVKKCSKNPTPYKARFYEASPYDASFVKNAVVEIFESNKQYPNIRFSLNAFEQDRLSSYRLKESGLLRLINQQEQDKENYFHFVWYMKKHKVKHGHCFNYLKDHWIDVLNGLSKKFEMTARYFAMFSYYYDSGLVDLMEYDFLGMQSFGFHQVFYYNHREYKIMTHNNRMIRKREKLFKAAFSHAKLKETEMFYEITAGQARTLMICSDPMAAVAMMNWDINELLRFESRLDNLLDENSPEIAHKIKKGLTRLKEQYWKLKLEKTDAIAVA